MVCDRIGVPGLQRHRVCPFCLVVHEGTHNKYAYTCSIARVSASNRHMASGAKNGRVIQTLVYTWLRCLHMKRTGATLHSHSQLHKSIRELLQSFQLNSIFNFDPLTNNLACPNFLRWAIYGSDASVPAGKRVSSLLRVFHAFETYK